MATDDYISREAKHQEADLELARAFADDHMEFDDSFLTSIEKYFADHGYLCEKQHDALIRIIEAWKMEEYFEKT